MSESDECVPVVAPAIAPEAGEGGEGENRQMAQYRPAAGNAGEQHPELVHGIPLCEKCQRQHVNIAHKLRSCNGHNRLGGPCGQMPIRGGTVCRLHGGAVGAVKKKALERRQLKFVEGKIAKLLAECDVETQHPLDGLLDVVRQSGAMVRMLAGMVGELDPHNPVIRGMPVASGTFTGPDHLGDGAPNVLLTLYGQWADRYARACKLALDANIDERLLRNAEATSDAMFKALGRAVEAAGLTAEQSGRLRGTLASELRRFMGMGDVVLESSPVG